MADVFISYSRRDREFMERLYRRLKDAGFDSWVDWEDIPTGSAWRQEIFDGIEAASKFVCILSPDWLTSEICHAELTHARKHNKALVPVVFRETTLADVGGSWLDQPWEQTARDNWRALQEANWLHFRESDDFAVALEGLIMALREDQAYARYHADLTAQARRWESDRLNPDHLLRGQLLAEAEQWLTEHQAAPNPPTDLHRAFVTESRRAEDERAVEAAQRQRQVQRYQRATQVFAGVFVLALIAGIAALLVNAQVSADRELLVVEQARIITLAAGGVILPEIRGSQQPNEFVATVTAVSALSQWTPIIEDSNGVLMVRVPAGCFIMGSIFSPDEQPMYEVCFDEPFWIDQYEVTNQQFGSGDTPGLNLPHTNVTWVDARDFCSRRQARLPTEEEWEYAARGPNSLLYPWGNTLVPDAAVYADSPDFGLAEVGSMTEGMSWIGAFDMSGNAREWVSTIARDYLSDDRLEDPDPSAGPRVVRGGSFRSVLFDLRTASRESITPLSSFDDVGFRCARNDHQNREVVSPCSDRQRVQVLQHNRPLPDLRKPYGDYVNQAVGFSPLFALKADR